MKFLEILYVFIFFSFITCQDITNESKIDLIRGIKVANEDELNNLLKTTDLTYFVYVYLEKSEVSQKAADQYFSE